MSEFCCARCLREQKKSDFDDGVILQSVVVVTAKRLLCIDCLKEFEFTALESKKEYSYLTDLYELSKEKYVENLITKEELRQSFDDSYTICEKFKSEFAKWVEKGADDH